MGWLDHLYRLRYTQGMKSTLSKLAAANLQAALTAKNWSQSRLARESGVSFVTINRFFQGHQTPALATIELLACTLGRKPENIFQKRRNSA